MQYLRIKRGAKQIRADGSAYAVPIVITKTKKYGQVVSEKYVSRKRPVLITGAHDAGKTHWIMRLYKSAPDIWSKHSAQPLFLDAVRQLSSWSDAACVEHWWTQQQKQDDTLKPWSKLKAWERQDKLSDYLADSKAVLFIDNAEKLSGRKQQIVKECLQVQRLSVIAIRVFLPKGTNRTNLGFLYLRSSAESWRLPRPIGSHL